LGTTPTLLEIQKDCEKVKGIKRKTTKVEDHEVSVSPKMIILNLVIMLHCIDVCIICVLFIFPCSIVQKLMKYVNL
jgi:hypothetical protein